MIADGKATFATSKGARMVSKREENGELRQGLERCYRCGGGGRQKCVERLPLASASQHAKEI